MDNNRLCLACYSETFGKSRVMHGVFWSIPALLLGLYFFFGPTDHPLTPLLKFLALWLMGRCFIHAYNGSDYDHRCTICGSLDTVPVTTYAGRKIIQERKGMDFKTREAATSNCDRWSPAGDFK